MSDSKVSVDQYGRRTWDAEQYKKESGKKQQPDEIKSSKLTITDKPTSFLHHRDKLLNESINSINKHTLINPLNIATHGKNKRFGFFCPVCDLSFRDNLALIDHVNSPQHVSKSRALTKGVENDTEMLDGGIRRATMEEVVATMESLVAALMKKKLTGTTLNQRIEKRTEFELKRQQARELKKQKQRVKRQKVEEAKEEGDEFAAMMGFSGFKSTKK